MMRELRLTIANSTINEAEGYVTSVNTAYINGAMTDYKARVMDYIASNYTNATVGDMLGSKRIEAHKFGRLPILPMFKMTAIGWEKAELPDSMRHKIGFGVVDSDNILHFQGSYILSDISRKRISVSFSPATTEDESIINSGYPDYNLPAYMIYMIPELRFDGVVVASGHPVQLGDIQVLSVMFDGPFKAINETLFNKIVSGEYYGIGLIPTEAVISERKDIKNRFDKLETLLSSASVPDLSREDIVGENMEGLIKAYFMQYEFVNCVMGRTLNVVRHSFPSMGMALLRVKVDTLWDMPYTVRPGGVGMDVDRLFSMVKERSGDSGVALNYKFKSGLWSSALEHMIPEIFYSDDTSELESISAVKALKIANDLKIPLTILNSQNYADIEKSMSIPAEFKLEMLNAINAGLVVITPLHGFSYLDWSGIGFIILDPVTGVGSYQIGGMSGSEEAQESDAMQGLKTAGASFVTTFTAQLMEPRLTVLTKPIQAFGKWFGPYTDLLDMIVQMEVEDMTKYPEYLAISIGAVSDVVVDTYIDKYIEESLVSGFACMYYKQVTCSLLNIGRAIALMTLVSIAKSGIKFGLKWAAPRVLSIWSREEWTSLAGSREYDIRRARMS